MTRDEIVSTARTYLGTRFHHAARKRGIGVDCAGLIICVGHDLGLMEGFDFTSYGRRPDGATMRRLCEEQLVEVPLGEAKPGDVYLMRITRLPQHLAIRTDIGILHSHEGAGGVVEHRIDPLWQSGCWRLISTRA